MRMSLYTILNLSIVVPALLLSFDRRVAFWRSWPPAAVAVLVAGGVFVVWDVLVTEAGHWAFSPRWAGAGRLFGLPAGEVLFFATVPFACIFILEVSRAYFAERRRPLPRVPLAALAAAAFAAAFFLRSRGYTFLALTSLGVALLLMAGPCRPLFSRRTTRIALLLTYLPFLVFNGIFTGLPIVTYDPSMILGPRFLSIPVEDFVYSFSLMVASYAVFDAASFLRIGGKR